MATDQTDQELEEIQDRVDEIRRRLPDNEGLDIIDEDDVPAYFDDDEAIASGGVSKEEAERRDPGAHQGHAPG
jgi:hypothetical protein